MTVNIKSALLIALSTIMVVACNEKKDDSLNQIGEYVPSDYKLYEVIKKMDHEFFEAYNNCDLKKQADIYSNDIEFFHDQGGLTTSKDELIAATKNNICNKVTRELVPGSIEVYPINNYGAVEIGYHKFHNNQEPDAPSLASKFIIIWINVNKEWQIAKVVSLH